MNRHLDLPAELEVVRVELIRAFKAAARVMGKYASHASLRFEDGWLSIETASAAAEVPASGVWPDTIFVSARLVRRLATKMPAGDPVRLRARDGRVYIQRYSERCVVPTVIPPPPDPDTPEIDVEQRILEAATILKPLLIAQKDLETLVTEVKTRGAAAWRPEEKRLISLTGRAWERLAPLGVETADIRRLIDLAVRNAWKK